MENKIAPNQIREISGILAAADHDNPVSTAGGDTPDADENSLYQLDEQQGEQEDGDEEYEPDLNNSIDEEDEAGDEGGIPDAGLQEEQLEITTITDLAEELDVDPEVFYNLNIPMRGGLEAVPLSKLKDVYQEFMEAGAPENMNGGVEEANQLRAQLAQVTHDLPVQHEALTSVDTDLAALKQQYDNVDWPRFEAEQPAESVLQKQKFSEAFAGLKGKRDQIANGLAQQQAQASQQFQQSQWGLARQSIDGWANEETMHSDLGSMSKSLQGYGFQTEEIRQIVDARLLRFINDAVKMKAKLDQPAPRKKAKRGNTGRLRAGSLRGKPDASAKRAALIKRGSKDTNPHGKARAITELLQGG